MEAELKEEDCEKISLEVAYLESNKIKVREIDGEKIYLKKGNMGLSIVHPLKSYLKERNGEINWKNLISGGSWIKLGITLFIILIILGCIFEYSNTLKVANDCLNATRINYIPVIQ
jgi:hypothetical protein